MVPTSDHAPSRFIRVRVLNWAGSYATMAFRTCSVLLLVIYTQFRALAFGVFSSHLEYI